MKTILLFCLIAVIYAYDDVDDNVDIDAVINNPKKLLAHVDCYLDKGQCTPEMEVIKGHIQKGVKDLCARCTQIQRTNVIKTLQTLMVNHPEDLIQLQRRYDPEGIALKRLQEITG